MFLLLLKIAVGCDYSIEFSECFNDKFAALVTSIDCEFNNFVLTELPCNFSCPSGNYLDVDIESKTIKCSLCKSGTYSIGGGTILDLWNIHKYNLKSYCWAMGINEWELNTDCTSWHISSDNVLVSGTTSKNKWYETSLVLYTVLVKDGSLIVHYRKDSTNQKNLNYGNFDIIVDGINEYSDYELYSLGWKNTNISLSKGVHEIEIAFNKFAFDQVCEVQIKEIQIRGTHYASYRCDVCGSGSSDEGSEACFLCDEGSYMENNTCIMCPEGTSSWYNEQSCRAIPPCSVEDYHYYYSDCEAGIMKKVYEWNTPLMCNIKNSRLPDNENSLCKPCGTGKYYENFHCDTCPAGMFISNSSYGELCEECGPGKYAPKIEEYSEWSQIPDGFEDFCFSKLNTECSYGWEPRGTYIVTSPIYDYYSFIIIQKKINIIESNSKITYSISIKGDSTRFILYINGFKMKNYASNISIADTIFLSKGDHVMKFVCFHNNTEGESCSIFEILIQGSKSGGASACINCEIGYYSNGKTDECLPCESGYTSNDNHTGCIPCIDSFYSEMPGICKSCIDGVNTNKNHTGCVANSIITIEDSQFFIGNLTGSPGEASLHCKEDRLKLSCFNTFYGPTESEGDYFYLSVLNPSRVEMPSYAQTSFFTAYAFGILDRTKLSITEQELLKPEDSCAHDYSKIIVNLGSEIKSLNKTLKGFNVTYDNGDICESSQRFSTNIEFVCDKSEIEGWPINLGYHNCNYEFYWPTIYACEICKENMINFTNGTCEKGERIIHKFEGEKCVFGNGTGFTNYKELCSNVHVLKSIPFIVSMVLATVLLLLIGVTIIMTYLTRKRYYLKLVTMRESTSVVIK